MAYISLSVTLACHIACAFARDGGGGSALGEVPNAKRVRAKEDERTLSATIFGTMVLLFQSLNFPRHEKDELSDQVSFERTLRNEAIISRKKHFSHTFTSTGALCVCAARAYAGKGTAECRAAQKPLPRSAGMFWAGI